MEFLVVGLVAVVLVLLMMFLAFAAVGSILVNVFDASDEAAVIWASVASVAFPVLCYFVGQLVIPS